MSWQNVFANLATIASVMWDQNFNQVGALCVVPCTATGTNAITMTPAPSTATPPLAAYSNYMMFSGIVPATNTGTVTIAVGTLGALNGFIDTGQGPRQCVANDLIVRNRLVAMYDGALGSGAGGFHLWTASLPTTGGTITGNVTLNASNASILMTGALATIAMSGNGALISMPGSVAAINLPSSTASISIGGIASVGSIQIGAGALLHRMLTSIVSIAFTAINPNSASYASVGLTGLRPHDNVLVGATAVSTGVSFQAFCNLNDTAVIMAVNATAATVTPPGGLYRISNLGWS